MNALDLLALVTLQGHQEAVKRILSEEEYAAKKQSVFKLFELVEKEHPKLSRIDVVRVAVTKVSERNDDAALVVVMGIGADWVSL